MQFLTEFTRLHADAENDAKDHDAYDPPDHAMRAMMTAAAGASLAARARRLSRRNDPLSVLCFFHIDNIKG